MDWIAVKDKAPPTEQWVNLTRNPEDGFYTTTQRINKGVNTLAMCIDIGYTYWKPVSSTNEARASIPPVDN